jgi:hypothetical protein
MTLRSNASRGGEQGAHLVTAAGEYVGVDDRVEQVRPAHRSGRGGGVGRVAGFSTSGPPGSVISTHVIRSAHLTAWPSSSVFARREANEVQPSKRPDQGKPAPADGDLRPRGRLCAKGAF